ncbi:membrane-associating domain-containing protein [Lasiosphaeria miniovina]|uniref:Membrane-associating domain-containing protein n=1 Tax=Lasiosphaeria miniovina TaxID=1954250 RepID=A0AA40A044_9PEZI|nr:membrane-associating domain-containing protein [Lasiosphaeria miniovina]KAK0706861.1 membrane-associating domain-containing protein [Lasiosphaeria miniovina]
MNFKIIVLILRVFQAAFAVVVLGLSAFVSNWYNTDTKTASPAQINFLIFAPLWSLLSIACLEVVPKFLPRLSNPYAALGLEATNVLFWFAGSVGLGVFMNGLLFCRGAVCSAAQADVAFSAFLIFQWAATAIILALDVLKMGFRKPRAAASAGPMMKEPLP